MKVADEEMEAVEVKEAVVVEEFRGQQGCIRILTIATRTDIISMIIIRALRTTHPHWDAVTMQSLRTTLKDPGIIVTLFPDMNHKLMIEITKY